MAALNAGHADGLYDLLHLPHVRISGGGVAIWRDRNELEATYLRDFYDRAGSDWHHTILDSAEVLHHAEDKAPYSDSIYPLPRRRRRHRHLPLPVDYDPRQRQVGRPGPLQLCALTTHPRCRRPAG